MNPYLQELLADFSKRITELESKGPLAPYDGIDDLNKKLHRIMCDKIAWDMTKDGHMSPKQVGIEARRRISGECCYKEALLEDTKKEMERYRIALAEERARIQKLEKYIVDHIVRNE